MKTARLSIADQLNLAFVAVFSLPLVALALFFGWRFERDLADRAEASAQGRLERTGEVIGRKMEILESASQFLVGYGDLVEFTARPGAPGAEDLLRVKDLLKTVDRIQALNPDILRMRIFLPNRAWPEVWPYLYSEDRVARLWWRPQLELTKKQWRLVHADDLVFQTENLNRNDHLVSLFKVIEDPYGTSRGSLQVAMDQGVFFDGLFGTPTQAPEAALWVPREGAPRDIWRRPLPPALVEAPATLARQPGAEGLIPARGGRPAVAWFRLPHLEAVLLLEVPRPSTAVVLPFQWALATGTLSILGLAALLFAAGSRLILRRLGAVSAALVRVRQGDWTVEVPVSGNDEVADLARTFQDLLGRLRELIDGVVREQVAAKDAELRALQSQINAHFLYNVLEAIRMTAFVDGQDRVADALAALGRSLRYGMEWDRPVVALEDELSHVEAYILLWNLRFGGSILWTVDLPPGARGVPLPKFTLQPLVENAVVHGLGPRGRRGTIRLVGRLEGASLVLEVADDGTGAPADRWAQVAETLEGRGPEAAPGRTSIGLANVHERLKKTFGREAGLVLAGSADGWTVVRFSIPWPQEAP